MRAWKLASNCRELARSQVREGTRSFHGDWPGLPMWASPARLKTLIKKLLHSLLSVGGGFSLSGPTTTWGRRSGLRLAPLAGARITPAAGDPGVHRTDQG